MTTDNNLLSVNNVVKHFDISGGFLDQLRFEKGRIRIKKTTVKAINDVSFFIKKSEVLGIVGESGCGKSTIARVIMGLYPPNSGEIYYDGHRIDNLTHEQMLPFRKKMQMIFQDPYASLNPRKTVRQTLEEPLRFHHPESSNKEIKDKIKDMVRWLQPGLGIKRWILAILLGTSILALGLAVFVIDLYRRTPETWWLPLVSFASLRYLPRLIRVIVFELLGMGIIAWGIIGLNRSLLGPFLRPGHKIVDRNAQNDTDHS